MSKAYPHECDIDVEHELTGTYLCKWCTHDYVIDNSDADDPENFCCEDCEVDWIVDRHEWTDS